MYTILWQIRHKMKKKEIKKLICFHPLDYILAAAELIYSVQILLFRN